MKIFWTLYTDTKREKNAQTLLNKITKAVQWHIENIRIEKYYKDNTMKISFDVIYDEQPWSDFVLAVLKTSQQLSYDIRVGGNLEQEINIDATENFHFSGLKMLTASY
ncbi:MAG: hypothetical protein GKR77_05935 [Legionellales bacterium]|nr:hypothetical protein [Legionellales bacterium]